MLLGGGTWGTVELKSEKRGGWERKRRSSSFFYQNMASRGDFQAKGNYGPSQRPGPPLHITAAPARLGPGPGSGLVTWHWGPGPLGARALSPPTVVSASLAPGTKAFRVGDSHSPGRAVNPSPGPP